MMMVHAHVRTFLPRESHGENMYGWTWRPECECSSSVIRPDTALKRPNSLRTTVDWKCEREKLMIFSWHSRRMYPSRISQRVCLMEQYDRRINESRYESALRRQVHMARR